MITRGRDKNSGPRMKREREEERKEGRGRRTDEESEEKKKGGNLRPSARSGVLGYQQLFEL